MLVWSGKNVYITDFSYCRLLQIIIVKIPVCMHCFTSMIRPDGAISNWRVHHLVGLGWSSSGAQVCSGTFPDSERLGVSWYPCHRSTNSTEMYLYRDWATADITFWLVMDCEVLPSNSLNGAFQNKKCLHSWKRLLGLLDSLTQLSSLAKEDLAVVRTV